MNKHPALALLLAASWLFASSPTLAQVATKSAAAAAAATSGTPGSAASPTRMQVKMERDEFLKTHRWDEPTDTWVLRKGVEAPTGVLTRAEVKAARDSFLSQNRWDQTSDVWVPVGGQPRVMSTMSRARSEERRVGKECW